jgi:gas vesicle protein
LFPIDEKYKNIGIFSQWYNFFLKFLKRKCMTSNTKIILGMLAAAAAGAAIGVLMAPEKGSELRRKIKDGIDEVMEDMSELLALGKDEMKNMYKGAKEVDHEMES